MAQKKIITLIETFNVEELKRFKIFLKSDYFNKNEDLVFIFEQIEKFLNRKKQNYSFEDFFSQQSKKNNKSIQKASMYKLLAKLYTLCKKFIAIQVLEENQDTQDINLIKYLVDKEQPVLFEKAYKEMEQNLLSENASISNYYNRFMLEKLKWFYESRFNDKKIGDINLNNKNFALDKFYIADKLKTTIAIIGRQKIVKFKYKEVNIDVLFEILNNENLIEDQLIKAYFLAIKTMLSVDDEKRKHYNLLKEHLSINANLFKEEAHTLYSVLRSETSKVFKEKKEFHKNYFEIYKNQFDNKTIYVDGTIDSQNIKNVTIIAIKLKEFDWLQEFLESHKDRIRPGKLKEEIYQYNMANLSFFKKDYKTTQTLIAQLFSNNFTYKYAIRRLELMLYYELEEWILLDSLINAFNVFLVKNGKKNLSERNLVYNNNFVFYYRKLVKYAISVNPIFKKCLETKKQLHSENKIFSKDWLSEKMENLTEK